MFTVTVDVVKKKKCFVTVRVKHVALYFPMQQVVRTEGFAVSSFFFLSYYYAWWRVAVKV